MIDGHEAASPTVPELTAGSGPAAVVPTLFGVSLSQHCPGRRLDPSWGPWICDAEHTVLHQVVAEHLETFLGAVADDRADDPTRDGFRGRAMGLPCAEPLGRLPLSPDDAVYVGYAP